MIITTITRIRFDLVKDYKAMIDFETDKSNRSNHWQLVSFDTTAKVYEQRTDFIVENDNE